MCAKLLEACLILCDPIDQTIVHQASLSMGFPRQKYWSGLPSPLPGDLPNTGIEPTSLMSPALAGGFFTTSATWEAQQYIWLDPIILGKNINYESSMISSPLGE